VSVRAGRQNIDCVSVRVGRQNVDCVSVRAGRTNVVLTAQKPTYVII